ncbi:hypothetical protein BS78_02G125300 [Paspalum vaginatum]|nr:hypothetical protein BS78_02G125300 [Paspalum vaginatum]
MVYALFDGIVGTVAFGNMYGSAQFEQSSFQHVMDETLRVLGSFTFQDFFPASGLARLADVLTEADGQRRSIFRKMDRFFDLVIDKHLEPERLQAGVQEDMVDALVKMWREQGDEGVHGFTRDHIKGILMDTFAGGINTCSVTMIWIMSELMSNPSVMRKAQTEVRSLVGNKPRVDEEDVKNLSCLCENECNVIPIGVHGSVFIWPVRALAWLIQQGEILKYKATEYKKRKQTNQANHANYASLPI